MRFGLGNYFHVFLKKSDSVAPVRKISKSKNLAFDSKITESIKSQRWLQIFWKNMEFIMHKTLIKILQLSTYSNRNLGSAALNFFKYITSKYSRNRNSICPKMERRKLNLLCKNWKASILIVWQKMLLSIQPSAR